MHLKDGFMRKKVDNNMPTQMGENENCLPSEKVTNLPDMSPNHKQRNAFFENKNGHTGYEEITRILGLKRMDSESGSDIMDFASARGSAADLEKGTYASPSFLHHEENGHFGRGSRRANGEMNLDSASLRCSAPPLNDFVSSQSSQAHGLGASEGSRCGKMKFLCSFGGKILPRPSDGKLRYIGGDTRIISIRNNLLWDELLKKTSEICKLPHSIKYQLPGEDLDALISVSSDEDLQNMIEEYQAVEKLGGSQRLRIFLIPLSESENTCPLDTSIVQKDNPDYQYVVALNGMGDPSALRNHEQLLANDKVQLKTYTKESEIPVNSSAQPSPLFPGTDRLGDKRSEYTPLYKEALLAGLDETDCSFGTAQLPPHNDCFNVSGCYHPAREEETSRNCCIPNETDHSQPSEAIGTNRNSAAEFVVSPGSNKNDFVDKYSCPNSMLKERIFRSENPGLHSVLSGSSDPGGSQLGMPQSFSDSKLQEYNAGASMYSSQEGLTPSSASDFAEPKPSTVMVSFGLQGKPLQLPQNFEIDDSPVHTGRTDFLSLSFGSDLVMRNGNAQQVSDNIDEKYQSRKDMQPRDSMLRNCDVENSSGRVMLNELDEAFLPHSDGKISKNNLPVSAVEYLTEAPSVSLDPFSVISIKNPLHELPISVTMGCKSPEVKLKPPVDEVIGRNVQLCDSPSEITVNGQRTGSDQDRSIKTEEYVDKLLWGSKLEGAAAFPVSKQEPTATNISTDLLGDFTDDPVSNESPPLHSGACGNNFNMFPSAVYEKSHRREVSLIDEDFVSYPDQRDFSSGIPGFSEETQVRGDVSQNKGIEQDQRDFIVQVIDSLIPGVESSSATGLHMTDTSPGEILPPRTSEAGSIYSSSGSENEKAKDENKGQSITDAMITELEAEIYGLQIIKNSDLEEMRELGSGTYGTVFHGKWRGSDVAIKRIKSSCFAGRSSEQDRLTKDFWREAQILSNLHHPNVVAFYGVVPDGAGRTLATVTEYMANGSLRSVLLKKDRSLDRRKKLTIAMDAAFGMEYLHSKNIVHFDLKCDNLLVNLRDPQRPICKVGDFGLSRIKRNTLVSGGVRGTLPWMAPELLNGSSSKVSEKVDVFSFGITMWEIITGEEPYANMHCGAIIGGILKDTLRPPIPEKCGPEWKKLIEDCWSTEPNARPSFTEITNQLRSMGQSNIAK